MATQQVTAEAASNESAASAFRAVFENHPDQNVTPYIDGRDMAGILQSNGLDSLANIISGAVTSDADSASDGIDVLLPFTPKFVVVFNESDVAAFFKVQALPFTLKAAVAGNTAPLEAAGGLKMGNFAADEVKAFHITNQEISAAGKVFRYVAMA